MFTLPIPEQSEIEPMFAYAPDGKSFAVAHSDGSISLWKLPDAKCIRMLRGPNDPASFVAFSPRGDIMASVHSRQTIALWRVSDGTLIDVIKSKFSIAQIVFSPDGTLMAAHAMGKSRGRALFGCGGCQNPDLLPVAFGTTGMCAASPFQPITSYSLWVYSLVGKSCVVPLCGGSVG